MIFSHGLLNKLLRHEAIIRAPNVCFELTFTCLIVFKTERSASALTLRFVLERYLVRTWPMLTTTLIEVSRDFSLFLRANSGIMPQLRHDHFPPDSFQFIIYQCCICCGPDEERILDVVPREDGARNSG